MPKVENVEKKIEKVEGFAVQFFQNGRDVHGAKARIPQYSYTKAAKNDMTVNDWKQNRFANSYPGYDAKVLNGDRTKVQSGQTKLGTVRDTYTEES
ncbi:MAG: hypothetical protein ACYCS1_10835 [Gammaproteobacteria bacterium]